MIFHVSTKPISEMFEIPIRVADHGIAQFHSVEGGHLLEERLLLSGAIGGVSRESSEKCLPARNRRRNL